MKRDMKLGHVYIYEANQQMLFLPSKHCARLSLKKFANFRQSVERESDGYGDGLVVVNKK